jgi:hypothetical protein
VKPQIFPKKTISHFPAAESFPPIFNRVTNFGKTAFTGVGDKYKRRMKIMQRQETRMVIFSLIRVPAA